METSNDRFAFALPAHRASLTRWFAGDSFSLNIDYGFQYIYRVCLSSASIISPFPLAEQKGIRCSLHHARASSESGSPLIPARAAEADLADVRPAANLSNVELLVAAASLLAAFNQS
jgi:hypothetical protein